VPPGDATPSADPAERHSHDGDHADLSTTSRAAATAGRTMSKLLKKVLPVTFLRCLCAVSHSQEDMY
jgi:hypothetical protein